MARADEDWVKIGDYRVRVVRPVGAIRLGLSHRESEALGYLIAGWSVNETAKKMGVTPNTASTFKVRIFRKLGVSSTAEAALIASAVMSGGDVEHVFTGVKFASGEPVTDMVSEARHPLLNETCEAHRLAAIQA